MTAAVWDLLWINCRLATMAGDDGYGQVEDGAIAVCGDTIAWLGRQVDLPVTHRTAATQVVDAGGRWVTPGLIDCHTHLVHGGHRAAEFEMRLHGATYADIAQAGGGIRSTVDATRAAGEEALFATAAGRLERLLAEGVTAVEIKSGYGLDIDNEIKMLRVAARLGAHYPVTVRKTFLGAHALAPEFEGDADAYTEYVCRDMLPAAHAAGLVDAVDAFCERIAFDISQTRRVLEAAQALKLAVKLHAEQLSDMKGAVLAAEFGALSADHLEYIQTDGVAALARAGSVAVLLPGAFYFLRETKLPPIALFREYRVPMAIATDSNPGSSPTTSPLLMLNMACTLFRLTPAEALAGMTRHAARALGLAATHGTLEVGKRADFAAWDIETPAELAYRFGVNPCWRVVRSGRQTEIQAR